MKNKFNTRWQSLSDENILILAPEGAVFYLVETDTLFGGYVRGKEGEYKFSNGHDGWHGLENIFSSEVIDLEELRAEMEEKNLNNRGEGI